MFGLLINDQEVKEIEYLIKRELDEILFDLKDERSLVSGAIGSRHKPNRQEG